MTALNDALAKSLHPDPRPQAIKKRITEIDERYKKHKSLQQIVAEYKEVISDIKTLITDDDLTNPINVYREALKVYRLEVVKGLYDAIKKTEKKGEKADIKYPELVELNLKTLLKIEDQLAKIKKAAKYDDTTNHNSNHDGKQQPPQSKQ